MAYVGLNHGNDVQPKFCLRIAASNLANSGDTPMHRTHVRFIRLMTAALVVFFTMGDSDGQEKGTQEVNQSAANQTEAVDFFPGFEAFRIKTSGGVTIAGVKGGSGPPVLLLHGAPCNLVNWRKVAPT